MSVSNSFDVRGRALEADELAAWLSEHSLGNRFGLTVAATGVSYAAKAVAVVIVAADGDGRFIRIADLTADDELARIDSSSLLSRLELPVQRVLAGMETAGVAVDRALLSRLDGAGPVQATVAELLSSIAADRRVHATFHQTTTTSRISSSQP